MKSVSRLIKDLQIRYIMAVIIILLLFDELAFYIGRDIFEWRLLHNILLGVVLVLLVYVIWRLMRYQRTLTHQIELEQMFSSLTDIMDDAMVAVDETGQIALFNKGAERLFQYNADEIIGQPIDRLLPSDVRERHHKHMQRFGLESHTSRMMGEYMEVRAVRKDGDVFAAEATITKGKRKSGELFFMVVLRDVTQRKLDESRLKESEERYRLLAENATDLIAKLDLQLTYLYASPNSQSLLGHPPDALVGRCCLDLVHPEDIETVTIAIELLQLHPDVVNTITYRVCHSNGSTVWIESTARALKDSTDQIDSILMISRDVTDRKQLEQELRAAIEKERELSELKLRFTSLVSHEFRTPLSIIQTSSEMLKRYNDAYTPEKRAERLEKIMRQTDYMRSLMNDVLFFSKAQSNSLEIAPALIDIVAFCDDLVEQIQLASPEHTIQFQSSSHFDHVTMDPRLLQQIIMNLLSNAVRYSPADSTIHFDLARVDGQAIMTVRDEGIGIPKHEMEHLFEPFYRAQNARSIQGTGLGLFILKSSVEKLGGSIVVDSVEAEGTIFTVHLPL